MLSPSPALIPHLRRDVTANDTRLPPAPHPVASVSTSAWQDDGFLRSSLLSVIDIENTNINAVTYVGLQTLPKSHLH